MLIVRVELHSAVTGKVTEIARMKIANDGTGDAKTGNYTGASMRKRAWHKAQRTGTVLRYPRLRLHVWHLVARMLQSMGYK